MAMWTVTDCCTLDSSPGPPQTQDLMIYLGPLWPHEKNPVSRLMRWLSDRPPGLDRYFQMCCSPHSACYGVVIAHKGLFDKLITVRVGVASSLYLVCDLREIERSATRTLSWWHWTLWGGKWAFLWTIIHTSVPGCFPKLYSGKSLVKMGFTSLISIL